MRNYRNHPLYNADLEKAITVDELKTIYDKTILITGATGLIGAFLIDALMKLNGSANSRIHIIAVTRNKEKAESFFEDYLSSPFFQLLVQDVRAPFPKDIRPDFILPFASNTHPLAYSSFPVETLLTNIEGAKNALDLAASCKATVLYPSSVEIYGNSRGGDVFTEDYTGHLNLSSARSCYSESKRSSEALCLSYKEEYGVCVKIARLSRIFGPTMQWSDSKASSQFIKKAINGEDIVLKSKGQQFFSYTYVADSVNALLYILLKGENGIAYNISVDSCNVLLRDFADKCASIAHKKVVFDIPSEEESRGFSIASKAIMDNSRLLSLGWIPFYDLDRALSNTVSILRDSKD